VLVFLPVPNLSPREERKRMKFNMNVFLYITLHSCGTSNVFLDHTQRSRGGTSILFFLFVIAAMSEPGKPFLLL